MGFIIKNGKVVKARELKLTYEQKKELCKPTKRQKEIYKELRERAIIRKNNNYTMVVSDIE